MKAIFGKSFGTALLLGLASVGFAQVADWDAECIDPANTNPYSNPLLVNGAGNLLMFCSMGVVGTVGYGDTDGDFFPCYTSLQTLQVQGRFAFSVGSLGSVQQSSDNFDDANMALTLGAPTSGGGAYCYATSTKDGTRTLFGTGGLVEAFHGFSNRYISGTAIEDGVRVKCQMEVVGDATRMRWTLTNLDTASHGIGLWWGAYVAMLTDNGKTSNAESGSASQSHNFLGGNGLRSAKDGYVYIPNGRPPVTDVTYDRVLDPTGFPDYVDFLFGQTDAFGMRLENTPSAATADIPANNPTEANVFKLGKGFFQLGPAASDSTFPSVQLPDTDFRGEVSFIQQFPEQIVAPGASRQVLYYVRSPWGNSNYALPYGAVVDAPKVIGTRATDAQGNPTNGGISPNPFTVRVYVDNVGGYGFDGHEFPLNDVKIKLTFGNTNIAVSNGNERVISLVDPRTMRFTDFTCTADEDANGDVPYTVTIDSQPGNVHKVMPGKITIAARPRLKLYTDANFVTVPYSFLDSSWQTVFADFLDPNVAGGSIQAFVYDPQQHGYVISLGAERGKSYWILYTKDANAPVTQNLQGSPTTPPGFLDGAPLVQLRQGWNQIGDPYNYSFPINQILGVSAANPGLSYKWLELVSLGYVSNYLAEYDPATGDYSYIDGNFGEMQPGKGYWVYVATADDLTINYPPLFQEFVPGQPRTAGTRGAGTAPKPKAWSQSATQWRLKLTARNDKDIDAENYIGLAATSKDASALRVMEPPMAPKKDIGLSIADTVSGQPMRLAQDLQVKGGRKEFNVMVDVKKAGQVTLTWPNLATIPNNLRLRLTDTVTNASRDLRQSSGYTFTADKEGTRTLKLTVEEGTAGRAVIGNVIVSRPGGKSAADKNAPITVAYTLSSDAATSVRILAANGREVYSATRGRADRAGENTITWTLRDKANRAVAPGTYRVEIIAETSTGERVRKVVPVNVIR